MNRAQLTHSEKGEKVMSAFSFFLFFRLITPANTFVTSYRQLVYCGLDFQNKK